MLNFIILMVKIRNVLPKIVLKDIGLAHYSPCIFRPILPAPPDNINGVGIRIPIALGVIERSRPYSIYGPFPIYDKPTRVYMGLKLDRYLLTYIKTKNRTNHASSKRKCWFNQLQRTKTGYSKNMHTNMYASCMSCITIW